MWTMADIEQAMIKALSEALTPQDLEVTPHGGGHFSIKVTSGAFEGKGTLEKHRMVLNAIKELMAGDAAPVHAIDSIQARAK